MIINEIIKNALNTKLKGKENIVTVFFRNKKSRKFYEIPFTGGVLGDYISVDFNGEGYEVSLKSGEPLEVYDTLEEIKT